MSALKRLVHEVHRRSLWQVLGVYLAVSWVVLQVVDVISSNFGLPAWVAPASLVLLLLGLPVVLATAFVQEGIHPSKPPREESPARTEPASAAPGAEAPGRGRFLSWRNALVGGGAAFALLGIATAGYLFMRSAGIGPAGTLIAKGLLEERARIMIADFESQNGDESLARTATEAFRVDFGQSQLVRVVRPTVVTAALGRMSRDADGPLDAELAREVAIREGIPAVVAGEINEAGGGFVLSVELIAAGDGEVLAQARETAADSSEIIDAIDALSASLRGRIGESLRLMNREAPLARVTTQSLSALRKYSQALTLEDDRALSLLGEAVAEDSGFAMAWRKLGAIYGNRAQERRKTIDAVSRAYENRDRLTDVERYHAEGMYAVYVSGDMERAVNSYQNLIEAFPDDDYGANNLGVVLIWLRRFERAEQMFRRAIEIDSANNLAYRNAAWMQVEQGRPEDARTTLEAFAARSPSSAHSIESFGLLAGAEGDYEAVARAIDRYEQLAGGSRFGRWRVAHDRADLAAIGGRIAESDRYHAEAMAIQAERGLTGAYLMNAVDRAQMHSLVAADQATAAATLDEALSAFPLEELDPADRPMAELALGYATAGRSDRAIELLATLDDLPREFISINSSPLVDRARGTVALMDGDAAQALAHHRRSDRGYCTVCALPGIGRAFEAAGQPDSALVAYRTLVDTPYLYRVRFGGNRHRGPVLERLGQLYDERGDLENAVRFYAMFVELWAEADEVLQPRVRAAQTRLEEILAARG